MSLDLYYMLGSPPCHAVMMVAKAVGVDLNLKPVDLFGGEHKSPEFLKINPQHTVPTLVDDGFILCESRAILAYLADKYDKSDTLYPKCSKERAIINHRLFFDLGTLYARLADYYYTFVFYGGKPDPEKLKKLEEAAEIFNVFLEGKSFVAGDNFTVADIALLTTTSVLEVLGFGLNKYPNIARWYADTKAKCPGYNLNEEGMVEFKKFMQ